MNGNVYLFGLTAFGMWFVTCRKMTGKQEKYSFSPVLFTDEIGNSLLFVIKPCKDKGSLRDMIQVCVHYVQYVGGY